METRGVGAVAALALALAAAQPARAQESILDQPPDKEGWPKEITARPLTLAPGMFEATVAFDANLSANTTWDPSSLAPNLYYGVAQGLTIGVRHLRGFCLTGAGNGGCPEVYDDVSLDSIWSPVRDLAVGLALNAGPLDPFALSVEVRVLARFATGPIAIAVAPTLDVGVTNRDSVVGAVSTVVPGAVCRFARCKAEPLAFPMATTSWGFYQLTPSNTEFLSIPASLTVAVTPEIAFAVASALSGPLESSTVGPFETGGFGDLYTVPLGFAAILTPHRQVDVGASFTFTNLFGKSSTSDGRAGQIFASFRL